MGCYRVVWSCSHSADRDINIDQGRIRGWGERNPRGGLTYYYRPQRSCGKVMFSQACVKNSVHRGVCILACTGQIPPTQYMLGYMPPAATAVDGTHPTGMHSCLA